VALVKWMTPFEKEEKLFLKFCLCWTCPISVWAFSIAWCQTHLTSGKPLLSSFILPTFWYEWLMSFTPWWTVVEHIAVLLHLLNFVAWKSKYGSLSSQWAQSFNWKHGNYWVGTSRCNTRCIHDCLSSHQTPSMREHLLNGVTIVEIL